MATSGEKSPDKSPNEVRQRGSDYKLPFAGRRESELMKTTNQILNSQRKKFYRVIPQELLAAQSDIRWEIPIPAIRPKKEVRKLKPIEPITGFTANQRERQPEEIRKKAQKDLSQKGLIGTKKRSISSESSASSDEDEATYRLKRQKSDQDIGSCRIPEITDFLMLDPKIFKDITDPLSIVALIRKYPQIGFLYMIHPVPRSSVRYTPYTLKIVAFDKINKNDYFTISSHGISHFWAGEASFTELNRWEKEYKHYLQLLKRRTFRLFRSWKAFRIWYKTVRYLRITECRKELIVNLYILNPHLQAAMLKLRQWSLQLMAKTMLDADVSVLHRLDDYLVEQRELIYEQHHLLICFKEQVKQLVRDAACNALLAMGFVPDYCVDNYPALAQNSKKMTYAEQANKRNYCQKLTRFIRMVDYFIVSTKHQMVIEGCRILEKALYDHMTLTVEQKMPSDKKTSAKLMNETVMALAFFQIELQLVDEHLLCNPSEEDHLEGLLVLINEAQKVCIRIPNLTPDSYFDSFTRPRINKKFEEKTCGLGPNITAVFDGDTNFQGIVSNIKAHMRRAFFLTEEFMSTLEPVRTFYLENESLDLAALRLKEHSVNTYVKSLKRYTSQQDAVNAIPDHQVIGIIYLELIRFKNLVMPSPTRCLDVFFDMLPKQARQMVDSILAEVQDAQMRLEKVPVRTEDFVEQITFLDMFQLRVDEVESISETVGQLYKLVDLYKIPARPEDFALYSTMAPILTGIRILLDKAVDNRDTSIDKFCIALDADITLMEREVMTIKDDIENPMILEPTSSPSEVKELLDSLNSRFDEYLKQANLYRSYQRQFKVEITEYPTLDAIQSELKLKELLWSSLESWDVILQQWMEMDFNTLDPEVVANTTNKYAKTVQQLEKGLPPNGVTDNLKAKVFSMKDQLAIIADLRNPQLKPRHVEMFEKLFRVRFSEKPLSLQLLKDVKAIKLKNEIAEISGQATSEAGLEALLKKIEENWKGVEFILLPYRDSRDVFILGSTEEIQLNLDDSVSTINLILSSRYCGPIKTRVEEWQKNLELFGKTLEEWQNCQRNWLYLESIFSAPDIQRQLPAEAKMFAQVDKSWKDQMRRVNRMPLAIHCATQPGLLELWLTNNNLLDQIMKCLEAYLESKRMVFPRFYFLSNEELLDIIAQARNPQAIQTQFRKFFEAIFSLEFVMEEDENVQASNEILAMVSPEGEKVPLTKGLKARGNVEEWLVKLEESIVISLRRLMKFAIIDYYEKSREVWVMTGHASQIVLAVSQMMWCRVVHEVLSGPHVQQNLVKFEQKNFDDLNKLATLVRGELTKLARGILCALITIDVHARDISTLMVKSHVESANDFVWQRQLRYYWDNESDLCTCRMSNSIYYYAYEYLGASPRLVITPLTDRCYLCLMGAMQMDLGGAPAGPAGTGKTETTKDLAKSLATQCVVFNCSDGNDYILMGKFFAGTAQCGAWVCFDEFNRIELEVLSVVAQQLITIRYAKLNKFSRFLFEGREIRLINTCCAFITMNPGYAGRTELPDNLKALFRPISMMVPNYTLIAEVILYSEGFEGSKDLARKMTSMYRLCSEQLSQQDHYDFGMRAVKSVLVMAGSLKRENPNVSEDLTLIRALRDSNLPKFLSQDAQLFKGILQDLFPGSVVPELDYGVLQTSIVRSLKKKGLQAHPVMITRVIQLYDTMIVRHGVMLVGPTGGGKTVCLECLKDSFTYLYNPAVKHPQFKIVHMETFNPKSITMGELYGEINKATMEWKDGILGYLVRSAINAGDEDHRWIVHDGPVDAVWIENLNSVLDDNKLLCLGNSERMKLTPYIHMIFEVEDLSQASPATVSRCGMVYLDPSDMRWYSYVKTWTVKIQNSLDSFVSSYLWGLFEKYVDNGLAFINRNCVQAIPQVDISKVATTCFLLESHLINSDRLDLGQELTKIASILCQIFVYAYLWGVGGNLIESSAEIFEKFVRSQFEESDAKIPSSGDLWNLYMDFDKGRLDAWDKSVPFFRYNPAVPFFDMLVPTVDTVKYGFILTKLLQVNRSVLFTGTSGVGKSVIARAQLLSIMEQCNYIPVFINFSAQTSSIRTQEMIESKLEKRRKGALGAPAGKRIIIFVDDVNMPKVETYGAQPPIELLRQFQDFGGFWDRDRLVWREIQDVTLSSACAPPGGGRNPVTPRFLRHFSIFCMPAPNEKRLRQIFKALISGFFQTFTQSVKERADSIVSAAVEIYNRMSTDLLPTPAKSHYVFNLRDLSKCVQGIMMVLPTTIRDGVQVFRLFCHECLRVFHDRLISKEDKGYFVKILSELSMTFFNIQLEIETLETNPIIFGDFMKINLERVDRVYEEIKELDKLKKVLAEYLDDYNITYSKETKIVFFIDAIEHITRIVRILRQERGNALLVGVGGTGKQSLSKLSCHIGKCIPFQIELKRGYDYSAFHDDLKILYDLAGLKNNQTVFLFADTQIVMEEFVEDINNMLNSGEVPNLFAPDDVERFLAGVRQDAKQAGVLETDRDAVFTYFVKRTRANLHIILCMSPVGDGFRTRCRMFPSLVNCCTIDWYTEWPTDALLGVAHLLLKNVEMGAHAEEIKANLADMCVAVHESVGKMSVRFYEELRRYYYTTPTSYLDLLNLYSRLLDTKRSEIQNVTTKLQNGLQKIAETNVVVAEMQVELTALQPVLKQKQESTEKLMTTLVEDQERADAVRMIVQDDEAMAKVKAEETQLIADEAQRDLDEVLPALEASIKALDALDKSDIAELRVFQKPPEMVQTVMEAVCILFNVKTDWPSAKQLLSDPLFLRRLSEYDKDNIPDIYVKKLKKYVRDPNFVPEVVEKVSKACKSMCMWVRAMIMYANAFKQVEPKRRKLEAAQDELRSVQAALKVQQDRLGEVEAQIASLQAMYNNSVNEKDNLEFAMAQTTSRLQRASRLTSGLADEEVRWKKSVKKLLQSLEDVIGNVFVATACIAYFGAFTTEYRKDLVNIWTTGCKAANIPISDEFNLAAVMVDPAEIRIWNQYGLPKDSVSTENAVVTMNSNRWPLMIDPQDQANVWIRKMEALNKIKILKLNDPGLLRQMEYAIRLGRPVLLEEVGETLEPALEPILLKQVYTLRGHLMIKLGDTEVDYDPRFKLYMTTKWANPHYLPEVCIKVTIINFTVTRQGLEDQILGDVVQIETPELEVQRTQLLMHINSDMAQLAAIEDQILKVLFFSEGNILDDEDLITTLNKSKITSTEVSQRLVEAEKTEKMITESREKYRCVAARGSVLYFVVASLATIDPMYQFSLKYFKLLFNSCIETSEVVEDISLSERLEFLIKLTTYSTYTNIVRGLFERHKLTFSLLLCSEILASQNLISLSDWTLFLKGLPVVEKKYPKKPDAAWLPENIWRAIVDIEEQIPELNGFCSDLTTNHITIVLGDIKIPVNPKKWEGYPTKKGIQKINWNNRLNNVQKLLVLKVFNEEKIVPALTEFVTINLGRPFVESPNVDLNTLYEDTNKLTPLVFILSPGSDPMGAFQRFAKEKGYLYKFQAVSLGQGQGPLAEKIISTAVNNGNWVFLQNCHVLASWMPRLEGIIKDLIEVPHKINDDFRLYLSSLPTPFFPVSVLQNAVKVTNEPPKGLRANIKRAFAEMNPLFFEGHELEMDWKRMIVGLTFFHAVIQERKKFGPLGWNIKYEFNDSDRESCLLTLELFCKDGTIPWDALEYITAQITYGGRVTDSWDQRTLTTILKNFFSPPVLDPEYRYSVSGTYYAPAYDTLEEYQQYADSLPIIDDPEVFGMHDNANLVFQTQETQSLLSALLSLQGKGGAGVAGKSTDDVVYEVATMVLNRLIIVLDHEEILPQLLQPDSQGRLKPFTVVLQQEIERFNKLVSKIKGNVKVLQKAIKGFVVMTDALEIIYNAFAGNYIPESFSKIGYPSLKTFGSYLKDLILRLEFIETWIKNGEPKSFWLSGFFFQQGYLTAALQTHARKYALPIDQLNFHFVVLPQVLNQADLGYSAEEPIRAAALKTIASLAVPEDGVLVHGLFFDAGRFDTKKMLLVDSLPKEMNPPLPVVHFEPQVLYEPDPLDYNCPTYKTSLRFGTLSTTGHSTNFVITIQIPTMQSQDYWTTKGTALLCQVTD